MNSIFPAFKREYLKSSQSGRNVEKRCTNITDQLHFDANPSASNMQLNGPQVTCGPPPEAPEGGSRTFQNKPEGSTSYATEVFAIHIDQFIIIQQVEYSCARGSQFLLENTAATAYVPKLNNRCLWRRFNVLFTLYPVIKINRVKNSFSKVLVTLPQLAILSHHPLP